jgi:hypothetical protein
LTTTDDTIDTPRAETGDDLFFDSTVNISPNRHIVNDTSNSFSTVDISPDLQEIADTLVTGDTVELPSTTITANTDIGVTVNTLKNDINIFRWEDDNWDFFEWTEITSLGTKTTVDSLLSNDSNSINEIAVYWEQGSWDTMTWTVPDDSGKFLYEQNEWESSDWGSLTWTPA